MQHIVSISYPFSFQPFDKCFLGSSAEGETDHMFCGQMSTVYLFSEALSPQQIHGVYQLGPSYKVSGHNQCTLVSIYVMESYIKDIYSL